MAKSAKTPVQDNQPSESLLFKSLTVNSFGGINKDNPVVVYFPKDKKIAKASGNQGVGKTSVSNALLFAVGEEFNVKLDNFVNLDDGTISEELEFEKNKKRYKVVASKSKFTLKKFMTDGSDSAWIDQQSPKELLSELIGHVATSPMVLKSSNGEKQIKWLWDVLKVPESVQGKLDTIERALKTATESRKDANRDYERIDAALSEEPLYQNWAQSEAKYQEKKDIESVKKKLEEATNLRQEYSNAVGLLTTVKASIKKTSERIEELKLELAEQEKELKKLEVRREKGENYIKENKKVDETYNAALQDFTTINEYVMGQETWNRIKRLKSERDQFETAVQELDRQKDQRAKEKKELIKSILPAIDGLEVITEDSIDKTQVRGIKVHGKTPAQLSESELFQLYFEICMAQGVSLVVIENISSFGSSAIETLNRMASKGVVVFATEMDRKKSALEITFVDELK